jgi:hypothetical protein
MLLLQVWEKTIISQKGASPAYAACLRLASFLSLLAFAPFVFPWLSPLL